jgi:hypothetical protein
MLMQPRHLHTSGLKPTRSRKITLQSGSESMAVSLGPQPAAASRSPHAFSCRLRMPQRCCTRPHRAHQAACTASSLTLHAAADDPALVWGECSALRCTALSCSPPVNEAGDYPRTTISCGLLLG